MVLMGAGRPHWYGSCPSRIALPDSRIDRFRGRTCLAPLLFGLGQANYLESSGLSPTPEECPPAANPADGRGACGLDELSASGPFTANLVVMIALQRRALLFPNGFRFVVVLPAENRSWPAITVNLSVPGKCENRTLARMFFSHLPEVGKTTVCPLAASVFIRRNPPLPGRNQPV
jgi:hypothetical protein